MIFGKSKQTNSPPAQPAAAPKKKEEPVKKPAPAAGPSILTSDLILEGNLATNGELQIDGTVHGAVQAAVCIIEANGVVHGSVMAEDVFIRGRVIGPICGVHVTVVAGAHVEGDILNQSLAIENGAFVDGKIRRSEDPMGEWQRMWYGEEAEPEQLTYDETGEPPAGEAMMDGTIAEAPAEPLPEATILPPEEKKG